MSTVVSFFTWLVVLLVVIPGIAIVGALSWLADEIDARQRASRWSAPTKGSRPA